MGVIDYVVVKLDDCNEVVDVVDEVIAIYGMRDVI